MKQKEHGDRRRKYRKELHVSAMIALEQAIRTGGWAIAAPAAPTRPLSAAAGDRPRKFYFVLDGCGNRLGYIAHAEDRPALETGGPTYLMKRRPASKTSFR